MSGVLEDRKKAESFLLSRRVVSLFGSIDQPQVNEIIMQLISLQIASHEPITILINSPGGHNRPALLLYEAIKHLIHCEVNAVVCGQCGSAATFVLLACKKRVCTEYSTFLIHSSRISGISVDTSQTRESDLTDVMSEVKKLHEFLVDFYVVNLRMSKKAVLKLIARGDRKFDNHLSAKEAIDIGLVQEFVTDKLPFFAQS